MKTLIAVVAGAALSGCTGETTCEYYDLPPTGDVRADIEGCWHGLGLYQLEQFETVVYQFRPGLPGTEPAPWREIQPPNQYFPNGLVLLGTYFVQQEASEGAPPVVNLGETLYPAAIEVTNTSLRVNFLVQTQNGPGVLQQPLRRAICTGFGFEERETQCPDRRP
jgi:hypothetical protein